MKKVISYSLYGSDDKYVLGLQHNINLLESTFPGWTIKVYYDDSVPEDRLMFDNPNVEYAKVVHDSNYMFWRFYTWNDTDVDVFISRDLDDRLNKPDFEMTQTWEESDCGFTVARCKHVHGIPIMGGLWGCKPKMYDVDIKLLIDQFKETHTTSNHNDDQIFLSQCVWPIVQNTTMSFGLQFNFNCHEHIELPENDPLLLQPMLGGVYEAHIKNTQGDV